jgi:hypothetical protein
MALRAEIRAVITATISDKQQASDCPSPVGESCPGFLPLGYPVAAVAIATVIAPLPRR